MALLLYWGNILLLGMLLFLTWTCAERTGRVADDMTPEQRQWIRLRIVIAQTLYAFGAALCIFGTYWSLAFIVLVQLNYAVAPKLGLLRQL